MNDAVNHPSHYTSHPSGVECIQITEHMNFCIGNAVKYLWRVGLKGDAVEDLLKARWYIEKEIQRIKAAASPACAAPVQSAERRSLCGAAGRQEAQ